MESSRPATSRAISVIKFGPETRSSPIKAEPQIVESFIERYEPPEDITVIQNFPFGVSLLIACCVIDGWGGCSLPPKSSRFE